MFHRKFLLAFCLSLAASVAAFGQGAGYLFQLAGPSSAFGNFYPYIETANPFNPVVSNQQGPAGVSKVIRKPDGTKFYLLGTSGANALESINASFTTSTSINGFGALPTAAAVTKDGKYLLVGADQLYVVDTNTDQVVSSIALPTTPVVGIESSRDSTIAYVVTNSSFGASSVTAYSLITRQRLTNPPTLNLLYGGANSITMSPLGLLYVTAPRRVYEIDPATLTTSVNGNDGIAVNAEPGPARFTPDGTLALFANSSPSLGGASILQIALATHVATTWPSTFNTGSPAPIFDDIYIKDSGHAYAFSSASNTLYDVTTGSLTAATSVLSPIFQTIGTPLAAAISTEVPEAGYLFFLAANGPQITLNRISLATNTLNIQGAALLGTGTLQFVTVPAQSNPGAFIQFNNPQTGLTAGSTTLPLVARVLTANGVPVFNYPVTFTTASASTALGLVINNPSPVTNADGYVQTTVTMPVTPGSYTVTLTAGVANVPFTLTIPGGVTCTTNCSTGGTTSQVAIVSGDGQLVAETEPTQLPLTILVTDTTGKPVPNVPVSYSVTSGLGEAAANVATTDANGKATGYFQPQQIPQGVGFQSSTVTASAQSTSVNYGSVNFTVTTFHQDPTLGTTGTGNPQVTPQLNVFNTINVSRGTPLPNAIVVQILSGDVEALSVPIPGVGIQPVNFYAPFDPTQAPPATCQGSTLSDVNGLAHCTLVVSCSASLGPVPLGILVGGTFQITGGGVQLNVTGGTASTIQIPTATLTGVSGQTLALNAVVQDGCGSPVAGATVTWTVAQGSASFKSTVSTSNAQGGVSAQLTLGSTPGLVQVNVTIAGVTQGTFSITNSQSIGGLSLTSGGNQTASVGQAFTTPLTFTVVDKSTPPNPVPGVVVSFSATTGTASLSPLSATSNAQGQVITSVTAGATAGPIVVTASTTSGFSAAASLTSIPASLPITSASFTNAASGAAGLVPCGLGTLIANGIASNVSGVISGVNAFGPLPYTLPQNVGSSGFSMTIDGVPVPLYSISNQNGVQQVNFQTPCEATVGQPATANITVNGGSTIVTGIQILQAQPGIFTYTGPNNVLYGAVISATDGSYVTPSNPAHIGQNYYLVATGLGQVSPPTKTNSAGIGGQTVPLPVVVGVSNAGVPVISAQYAVDQIGAYVVEFTIPAGSPTGPNQPLALAVIVNGASIFDNRVIYLAAVSN